MRQQSVASEDGGPCTDVNYDPLVLPSGIEASDDPILSARSSAYARSFRLRENEQPQKPPSAVTPAEVAASLRADMAATGADALNLRVHVPGVSPEEAAGHIAGLEAVLEELRA